MHRKICLLILKHRYKKLQQYRRYLCRKKLPSSSMLFESNEKEKGDSLNVSLVSSASVDIFKSSPLSLSPIPSIFSSEKALVPCGPKINDVAMNTRRIGANEWFSRPKILVNFLKRTSISFQWECERNISKRQLKLWGEPPIVNFNNAPFYLKNWKPSKFKSLACFCAKNPKHYYNVPLTNKNET